MSYHELLEYTIPKEWKEKMDKSFIKQMMYELHIIFGLNLDTPYLEYSVLTNSGTGGWYEAFANTCRKTNNKKLLKYYNSLAWYESDLFDGEVEKLFINYGLIIDGDMGDIIVEKTCFSQDEIGGCFFCGHWFPKEFITTDEDGDPICLHCLEQEKSENKNANNYYQESCKKNEEVLNKDIEDRRI